MSSHRTPEPWPYEESDADSWPTPEGDKEEFKKQLDLARLEVRKKRTDAEIATVKMDRDAALALDGKFYDAVFEIAKGSIDRARASADFVQKGASALVAIYGAVLGVAFSVSDRPLPARGLIPAFFLGLAVVCASYFIAWLPDADARADEAEALGTTQGERLANTFIAWVTRAALARHKWLRASVVALAAGLLFLPAPFLSFGTSHNTASARAAWPQPKDAAPGSDLELRKILYQAQVNQAAAAKPQAVAGKRDWVWWAGAGAVLILIVLLPQLPLRRSWLTYLVLAIWAAISVSFLLIAIGRSG
jgi:hypothetical protein